ncbi:FGGY-family carbohydrate kinase [Roseomonas xinghualingensis]|uniref:FGGY-family carbohydrate kinase n=1 Tax=Roseomonas xinghualingensis TaxID=2986475 RepID=UPI0021F0BBBF|nr:FGGY-family carbohydrate kinase [Roseomonas sp. SXEYE001]MCV4209420.1 FGGY-family carbohydrate kinase [Roseomonas sp. SXEYE001]
MGWIATPEDTKQVMRMAGTDGLLLAVDVGTLSARAGLFDAGGQLLASASAPCELIRPAQDHAVYRMDGIWAAVTQAVRDTLAGQPGAALRVRALAFDATSSLALSHTGAPPLEGDADVFCWADHRGEAIAEEITAIGDRLLDYTGGALSPEMHLPKLLWLKRHDPAAWARVTGARDLCDALAWRATGDDRHSLCGLACKWAFLPADGDTAWRRGLLGTLGIADLLDRGVLAQPPLPVGATHGRLSAEAAVEMSLPPGLPVAVGLIDAEAGTLGALDGSFAQAMNETLVLIGGTSTCMMAFAPDERRIHGVWGPFRDAVFPGLWMHEAGQSLTGAALDAVLQQHPAGPRRSGPAAHAATVTRIMPLLKAEGPAFAAGRHIVPDWLGNRSPLGEGRARALAAGLGEERGERDFLEAYYATARGIVLQARQILDHLDAHGYAIRRVALSGGHARNPLMVSLYRDALGRELLLPRTPEPVLLGTAMVAAVAAGWYPDLLSAVAGLAPGGEPQVADPAWARAHDIAFRIYLGLFEARNAAMRDSAALAALARQ